MYNCVYNYKPNFSGLFGHKNADTAKKLQTIFYETEKDAKSTDRKWVNLGL